MWTSKLVWIVWPAFLSACVLELLVFALVDPADLHVSGHLLAWSRQAVYTVAFFIFWSACLLSAALTTLIGTPAPKVTDCFIPPDERPQGCSQR